MNDRIEIMLATDARGLFMAHITIVSLLESAKGDRKLRINLLVDGFDDSMRSVIRNEVDKFDFAEVRFIEVKDVMRPHEEFLRKRIFGGMWAMMTWARCFCDRLLPDVSGKIIYMDTDTCVVDDLSQLFDTDLEGHVFGAVPESSRTSRGSRVPILDLSEKCAFYFNAGVMLFDIDAYRGRGGSERLLQVIEERGDKILLADQDALNCFADGDVKGLHPRWNYNDGWLEKQLRFSCKDQDYFGKKPKQILEAILSPGIVHYQSKNKPWRANHRPEGRRYEMLMRRLGYLKTRFLPGSTALKVVERVFFDCYHAILLKVAKARYALAFRNRV